MTDIAAAQLAEVKRWRAENVHPVNKQIEARMMPVKTNAWLLWFFLGGVWANAAYLQPKHRGMIIALGIGGLFLTAGVSAVIGILFGWIFNLNTDAFRAEVKAECEAEFLRINAIAVLTA